MSSRGAKEDSNWREILEYFKPGYQLGMTATPLRQDNRDTYPYFGNPIYTYSLREGLTTAFSRGIVCIASSHNATPPDGDRVRISLTVRS